MDRQISVRKNLYIIKVNEDVPKECSVECEHMNVGAQPYFCELFKKHLDARDGGERRRILRTGECWISDWWRPRP